jgi:hypothetical protein
MRVLAALSAIAWFYFSYASATGLWEHEPFVAAAAAAACVFCALRAATVALGVR